MIPSLSLKYSRALLLPAMMLALAYPCQAEDDGVAARIKAWAAEQDAVLSAVAADAADQLAHAREIVEHSRNAATLADVEHRRDAKAAADEALKMAEKNAFLADM